MIVGLPGLVGSHGGGFPPAGTWLSSVCSGWESHDQGNANYTDANGTNFYGMFTLWEQFADGAGGSYWYSYGNNATDGRNPATSCWLPQYFYTYNTANPVTFHWEGCGNSGDFEYGANVNFGYSNGDGTINDVGYFNNYNYPSGTLIFDGGCCQVFYDGMSGYYVSDNCGGGCPGNGTYAYSGCVQTSGYDASGQYWDGTWVYADFYNDGSCGYYQQNQQTNSNGCYYPYGYWLTYEASSSSLHWYIYDSCGSPVSDGDYTYSTSYYGTRAEVSGGYYYDGGSTGASYGDVITTVTYYDPCADTYYNTYVRYDGMGGYYLENN
jgi:hypothetical protein